MSSAASGADRPDGRHRGTKPPPAKRTATTKKKAAGGKGKVARGASEGFPIPLAYLYRDPRPAIVRRQQQAAASATAAGTGSDGGAGLGGDQWTETDGDGVPVKETPERQREKRTLYTANMAQAATFEAKYRYGDARDACTRALELQPGDKNALVCRSRCRLQMGDMAGALDDAEEALNKDANYVKATYQKAEVLYQMGRFEEALVFYHMGGKQRPDMELFQQGVRKAQEAIEVSLGVKKPSIQQQLQQRTGKKKSRVPPLNLNRSNWRAGGSAQRDSSQLLGDLHVDKLYLEKLIQNPGLYNPILPSHKIIHHAKETLEYLRARENFWRQQQPANICYATTTEKPKLKTKKKRRVATRTPTSTSFGTSSEGSGTNRERQTRTKSAISQTDDDNRRDGPMSGDVSEEERRGNPVTMRRSSSDEVHRILAENSGRLPEKAFLGELLQAVHDMTDCYQSQLWNRIVHIYLTQCWRGPSGVDDLTEEIEGKLGQLKLQEEQRLQQAIKAEDVTKSVCEMMQLSIDIAMLYLANGEEQLSKSFALRGTRLAQQANDKCGLIQVNLLMAALAALAADGPEISVYLARAREACSSLEQDKASSEASGEPSQRESAENEGAGEEEDNEEEDDDENDDDNDDAAEKYTANGTEEDVDEDADGDDVNHPETEVSRVGIDTTDDERYECDEERNGSTGNGSSYLEEDQVELDGPEGYVYQQPDIEEVDEDEYSDYGGDSVGDEASFETSGIAKQQHDD